MYLTNLLIYDKIRPTEDIVQDCNISIANALEILQSDIKPSIWCDEYSVAKDVEYF